MTRHRHRHLARQAADHLRGVPAGRRQHQPQVRRHRARPRDQPRAVAPAGRRDPARQRAAERQHVHAVPAGHLHAAAARRARSLPSAGWPTRRTRAAAGLAHRTRRLRHGSWKCRRCPSTGNGSALPETGSSSRNPTRSNEVGDDRDAIAPGDRAILHRRERSRVCALPARHGARAGLQGHRDVAGRGRAGARRRVQAVGDHARPLPARHRRLARARSPEERRRTRHIPVTVISTDEVARARARSPARFRSSRSRSRARKSSTRCSIAWKRISQRSRRSICWSCPATRSKRDWFEQSLAADDVKVTTVDGYAAATADHASRARRLHGARWRARATAGWLRPARRQRPTATPDGPPIIVYGERQGRRPNSITGARSRKHAVVRDIRSPERLLEQASLFLHRDLATMPEAHRAALQGPARRRRGAARARR